LSRLSRRDSHEDLRVADRTERVQTRVRSFHSLFTMPEPTKAAIAVPSKDPKKKEMDEKNVPASNKKPDEKEGEELVRYIFYPL
jgi:hypothetical protein